MKIISIVAFKMSSLGQEKVAMLNDSSTKGRRSINTIFDSIKKNKKLVSNIVYENETQEGSYFYITLIDCHIYAIGTDTACGRKLLERHFKDLRFALHEKKPVGMLGLEKKLVDPNHMCSQLLEIEQQQEETKQVLLENIDKLISRHEKMENLLAKIEVLDKPITFRISAFQPKHSVWKRLGDYFSFFQKHEAAEKEETLEKVCHLERSERSSSI